MKSRQKSLSLVLEKSSADSNSGKPERTGRSHQEDKALIAAWPILAWPGNKEIPLLPERSQARVEDRKVNK